MANKDQVKRRLSGSTKHFRADLGTEYPNGTIPKVTSPSGVFNRKIQRLISSRTPGNAPKVKKHVPRYFRPATAVKGQGAMPASDVDIQSFLGREKREDQVIRVPSDSELANAGDWGLRYGRNLNPNPLPAGTERPKTSWGAVYPRSLLELPLTAKREQGTALNPSESAVSPEERFAKAKESQNRLLEEYLKASNEDWEKGIMQQQDTTGAATAPEQPGGMAAPEDADPRLSEKRLAFDRWMAEMGRAQTPELSSSQQRTQAETDRINQQLKDVASLGPDGGATRIPSSGPVSGVEGNPYMFADPEGKVVSMSRVPGSPGSVRRTVYPPGQAGSPSRTPPSVSAPFARRTMPASPVARTFNEFGSSMAEAFKSGGAGRRKKVQDLHDRAKRAIGEGTIGEDGNPRPWTEAEKMEIANKTLAAARYISSGEQDRDQQAAADKAAREAKSSIAQSKEVVARIDRTINQLSNRLKYLSKIADPTPKQLEEIEDLNYQIGSLIAKRSEAAGISIDPPPGNEAGEEEGQGLIKRSWDAFKSWVLKQHGESPNWKDFYRNQRMVLDMRPVARRNPDGTSSTVRLEYSSVSNSDGTVTKHAVYPTLFPRHKDATSKPEDWIELKGMDAYNEAEKRGELMFFDSEKEAAGFAAGAWKEPDSQSEPSPFAFRPPTGGVGYGDIETPPGGPTRLDSAGVPHAGWASRMLYQMSGGGSPNRAVTPVDMANGGPNRAVTREDMDNAEAAARRVIMEDTEYRKLWEDRDKKPEARQKIEELAKDLVKRYLANRQLKIK